MLECNLEIEEKESSGKWKEIGIFYFTKKKNDTIKKATKKAEWSVIS